MSSTAPPGHEEYTVGWICALPIEMAAAKGMLDENYGQPSEQDELDKNSYYLGRIGKHNVAIACLPNGVYGTTSAATVASHMLYSFRSIKIGLMVGIGGGVPSKGHDIRLGDIVVSKPGRKDGGVVQFDFGKTLAGGEFVQTGSLNKPPQILLAATSSLERDHEMEESKIPLFLAEMVKKYPKMRATYSYQGAEHDFLYRAEYDHIGDSSICERCETSYIEKRLVRDNSNPVIYYGTIASGNQVMKHGATRDRLREKLDIVCFEMEAAGLMDNFPCLVIRGICDYADSHKNKHWQRYAAATAAAYAKELLGIIPARNMEDVPKIVDMLGIMDSKLDIIMKDQYDQYNHALLGWLSPLEPAKRHQDVRLMRHKGTCTWILKHSDFLAWSSDAPSSRALCCFGDPGAGKTLTISRVIDELFERRREASNLKIGLAYVYCDYRDQQQQTTVNLVGSMLKLLLSALAVLPKEIIKIYEQKCLRDRISFELSDATKIFNAIYGVFDQIYICIDAIDELVDKTQLLRFLQDMPSSVRIFTTGREHVRKDVQGHFREALIIPIEANEADLRVYIKNMVDENRVQDPDIIDEELEEEMMEKIIAYSHGMFLLPALHIRIVLEARTKSKRRTALNNLPRNLNEAFDSTIDRIKSQPNALADQAMQVLTWVHLAERPLKVDELLDALATEIGQRELDRNNSPGRKTFLDCCLGLVIIDKETSTVRMCHYSLQEYLITQNQLFQNGHEKIAQICVTYLMFESTQIESASKAVEIGMELERYEAFVSQYILFDYAACQWGHHIRKSNALENRTASLILKFLSMDSLKRTISAISLCKYISKERGYYLNYDEFTQSFLNLHILAYFGIYQILTDILSTVSAVDLKDQLGRTPLFWAAESGHEAVVRLLLEHKADFDTKNDSEETALRCAAMNGHEAVVRLLLEYRADVDAKDEMGGTALHRAAMKGREAVVRLLLEYRADVNAKDKRGGMALHRAAINGHEAVIRLLLKHKADIDAKDQDGGTALYWAAMNGHEAVVRLLLEYRADVDAGEQWGDTALHRAARNGHEAVVRLLLEYRTDIDTKEQWGEMALHWAAMNGHETVVRLLLEYKTDVDAKDEKGGTALRLAAINGHEAVVRLLLEYKADINTKDNNGETALHWTARNGHKMIVRLLLEYRTDVEAKDESGGTALCWAARNGHEMVVRLLLEYKTDINAKDKRGGTALYWAARNGYEAVVRLLLEYRADFDANDDRGWAALHWAARSGHEAVVRLLLQHRADVDAKDDRGRAALHWAAVMGHEAVVRLLLEYRADVDAKNLSGGTALYWAARNGHEAIVRLLLEHRADIDAKEQEGGTALYWAARNGHEAIVHLLRSTAYDLNANRPAHHH